MNGCCFASLLGSCFGEAGPLEGFGFEACFCFLDLLVSLRLCAEVVGLLGRLGLLEGFVLKLVFASWDFCVCALGLWIFGFLGLLLE